MATNSSRTVKKKKKVLSRKVKKTIRRSLSAICMISAIIVALVPAQPTRAYTSPEVPTYEYGVDPGDKTDMVSLDNTLNGVHLDLYGTAGYTDTDVKADGTPVIYNTKTVKQLSNGSYEVGWQFKMYNLDALGKGVICSYNSMYQTGTVEIAATLPTDYLVIDSSFYDTYFNRMLDAKTNNQATIALNYHDNTDSDPDNDGPFVKGSNPATAPAYYEITEPDSTHIEQSDEWYLENYFPDTYNQYVNKYNTWMQQYTAARQAWEAYKEEVDLYLAYQEWLAKSPTEQEASPWPTDKRKVVSVPSQVQNPDATAPNTDPNRKYGDEYWVPVIDGNISKKLGLKCWVSDMETQDKYRYFCVAHLGVREKLGGFKSSLDYTLEKVIDSRNGAQNPVVEAYMPKGTPDRVINSIEHNDSFGFFGLKWVTPLAIGKEAFKETTNVERLVLSVETAYIGDNAFEKSFVQSIAFTNVKDIGNRAFKDCTRLNDVELSKSTVNIGTEAFYGCNTLKSITFPESINYIGPGSFAECAQLNSVDISEINQSTCDIDNFAFYDDMSLTTLTVGTSRIARIGEAAFAKTGVGDVDLSETNIHGPVNTSMAGHSDDGIGDFAFAGCTRLSTFTMPSGYGRTKSVELPVHTFYNCVNMKKLIFPDDQGGSCGMVNFGKAYWVTNYDAEGNEIGKTEVVAGTTGATQEGKSSIFSTIKSNDFAVYGPESDIAGAIAAPRKATWGTKTQPGNDVPYIYTDRDGIEHVEISNGDYIFTIDDNGVLTSCNFADEFNPPNSIEKMTIPEAVGDTRVTGIASDCFSSTDGQKILKMIENLEFKDNTVSEIAPDAFKECTKLKTITIGNSVKKIGDGAFSNNPQLTQVSIGSGVTEVGVGSFENCPKLTYVNFETPAGGYGSFPLENIKERAFSTGASKLTFEGDINGEYGPFLWAMQKNNYVDESKGLRVCYTTGYPAYQTVIMDNRTLLPTLVDYLHYDQVDYYDMLLFPDAADRGTPSWASLTERYNRNGDIVYKNDGMTVDYSYSVTLDEEKLINAAYNLVVPDGIGSVDVTGFMNSTSPLAEDAPSVASNAFNTATYLMNDNNYRPYYAYYKASTASNPAPISKDDEELYNPVTVYDGGLFKGYYGDNSSVSGNGKTRDKAQATAKAASVPILYEYATDSERNQYEKEPLGNDRLKSVTLNTVEYLPDYCFYSCENLSNVNLGSKITDLGTAPFTACNKLTGIGSNTNAFTCINGIVYSENEDGTYNILEVLSGRGTLVGSQKIRASEEDPYLANVSTISKGAFENCDGITGVDFSSMPMLTEIPDNCFKDCDKLMQVTLPANVQSIGHGAFAGCMDGFTAYIYGKEVFLPTDAFGVKGSNESKYVESKRVVSYKDSAVRRAAADLGADVSEILDDMVTVTFYDYDGSEIGMATTTRGESLRMEDVDTIERLLPTRSGYTFRGWNKPLGKITEDMIVMATYTQNAVPIPDDPADPNGGNGGSGSGNNGGSSSGNNGGSSSGNNGSSNSGNSGSSDSGNSGNSSSGNNGSGTDNTKTNFYTLTVTNGNGSGSYAEGATVIITCTNPPEGYMFDKWVPTTADLGIASVNVAATTLTMPAHEAAVEATFKKIPTNTNTSTSTGNNGSNSGTNNGSNSGTSHVVNGNTVIISKQGISNTSLASATVSGSTDNFVIRIAETAAATAAVEKALTNEYGSLENLRYSAMDIMLYDSTGATRITDYTGLSVTITMPLPDVLAPYAGNNKAAGVVNEKLDKLNASFVTIDGVPCIKFTATHFSPYTIYVDTANAIPSNTQDITPKTGDGIKPKWFLVFGLAAISIALFFMKDKKPVGSIVTG